METTIKNLLDDMMEDLFDIRRPYQARSRTLVSQCRLLIKHIARRGYDSTESALLIEVLKASQEMLKAAVEAVPSMDFSVQDSQEADVVKRIHDVSEVISTCLRACGLETMVEQLKDELQVAEKKDQDALVQFDKEVQRQKSRGTTAPPREATVKLRLKLCVDSLDAPKNIELGCFDVSTRLHAILWKVAQPQAKKRIPLSHHSNFYLRHDEPINQHFERLDLNQPLMSLPMREGVAVIHLVTSKEPFFIVVRNHFNPHYGQNHATLVKDLTNTLQMAFGNGMSCPYYMCCELRNTSTDLVIQPFNSQVREGSDTISETKDVDKLLNRLNPYIPSVQKLYLGHCQALVTSCSAIGQHLRNVDHEDGIERLESAIKKVIKAMELSATVTVQIDIFNLSANRHNPAWVAIDEAIDEIRAINTDFQISLEDVKNATQNDQNVEV